MRLDDFLSTVGVIKRRTVAKEMCSNGMVEVNGHKAKAAYAVKAQDIIRIKGTSGASYEVLDIPSGSVPKENRMNFVREIS
jgi:ribosome-associated heat shock protein Hsp15